MTNPLPDCGRTTPGPCGTGFASSSGPGSGARLRRPPERVVASMLTTAGLRLSATSAKLTSPGDAAGLTGSRLRAGNVMPRAGRAVPAVAPRQTRSASRGVATGPGARRLPDVTPRRKAITAVSASVTRVNGAEHFKNYKPTSFRNAASSRTAMPSVSAFASLLPGSAPATT